jgi:hypothetical protein
MAKFIKHLIGNGLADYIMLSKEHETFAYLLICYQVTHGNEPFGIWYL